MTKWLGTTILILCTLVASAEATQIRTDAWTWFRPYIKRLTPLAPDNANNMLTDNSGAHAAAMYDYWNDDINWWSYWTTVVYSKQRTGQATQARSVEFRTLEDENFFGLPITSDDDPRFVCAATNGSFYNNAPDHECWTQAAWLECGGNDPQARAARRYARGEPGIAWGDNHYITQTDVRPGDSEPRIAIARFTGVGEMRACAVYGVSIKDARDDEYLGMEYGVTTNAGASWDHGDIIVPEMAGDRSTACLSRSGRTLARPSTLRMKTTRMAACSSRSP